MRQRFVRRHLSPSPYTTYPAPPRPVLLSSFRVDEETLADRYTVLRPIGELESATVPVFRQAVAGLGPDQLVIVDMSRVPFLDSSGIGALIGAVRRVRDLGGNVAVAGACPPVGRVLHLTGVDRIVELADTADEAAAVLSASAPERTTYHHPLAI